MKRFFFALTMTVLFSGISHAQTHLLSGPLDPMQALTNPDNVGSGTGAITGDYDDITNTLNYSINWSNLTSDVTNMHFHIGAPGVSGGVDLGIPGPWTSPYVGSGIVLSDSQESNLLAGNWYVNVHTGDFGGGEIRGQVGVTAVPEPNSAAAIACAVLATFGIIRRRRS